MPETRTCDHGFTLGHPHLSGPWNGPIGYCECCFGSFGYIGSGTWGTEGSVIESPNTRLCRGCGGRTIRVTHRLGEAPITETL